MKILSNNGRTLYIAGYTIIFVFLLGLLLWSYFAELSSTAVAGGVLQSKFREHHVQSSNEGIVGHVYVDNGKYVNNGDILVQLDTSLLSKQLIIFDGSLIDLLARKSCLEAIMYGYSSVKYNGYLSLDSNDSRVRNAIKVQNLLFDTHHKLMRLSDNNSDNVKHHYENIISGIVTHKRSIKKLINSYENELADLKSLEQNGFPERLRATNIERLIDEKISEIGDLQSRHAHNLLQRDDSINNQEKHILSLMYDAAMEYIAISARIHDLSDRIMNIKHQINLNTINSPRSGIVHRMANITKGSVINKGAVLMEIVPDDTPLMVRAKISPLDIDRTKIGQDAEIYFTSYNINKRFPGILAHVSADSIIDDDIQYYEADIEVTEEGKKMLNRLKLRLVPGMPAETYINTGSRTLFKYVANTIWKYTSESFIEK